MWRVPTDRGAPAFFAAVVVKSLVKHGWPAKAVPFPANWGDGFTIEHYKAGPDAPEDFWGAVEIAVRIAARTYRVEVDEYRGAVTFLKEYVVTPARLMKEVKP